MLRRLCRILADPHSVAFILRIKPDACNPMADCTFTVMLPSMRLLVFVSFLFLSSCLAFSWAFLSACFSFSFLHDESSQCADVCRKWYHVQVSLRNEHTTRCLPDLKQTFFYVNCNAISLLHCLINSPTDVNWICMQNAKPSKNSRKTKKKPEIATCDKRVEIKRKCKNKFDAHVKNISTNWDRVSERESERNDFKDSLSQCVHKC